MEPGGSLLCSQEPTTGSCPESDYLRQYSLFYFFKIHFNVSFYLLLGLPSGVLRSGLHAQTLYAFLCVLHAPPISSS
jgi:hypothetical protein